MPLWSRLVRYRRGKAENICSQRVFRLLTPERKWTPFGGGSGSRQAVSILKRARFQRGDTRFRDQVSSRRGKDCSYWCHPLGVASPANDTHTQLAPSEEIQYAENSYDPGLQPGRLSLFLQCPSTGLLRTRLSPWPLWCLRAQRCADPLGRDAR